MIPFYQSKTFWLNLLAAIILIVALFAPGSQFSDLLSPVIVKWLSLGAAVVNIILRIFFTEYPVANPFRAR